MSKNYENLFSDSAENSLDYDFIGFDDDESGSVPTESAKRLFSQIETISSVANDGTELLKFCFCFKEIINK